MAAATLLLCTADNFSTPTTDWWQFMVSCLLFIAAFVGVMFIKINPIRMIIYCALAGLILLY
jgi:chromate transporter